MTGAKVKTAQVIGNENRKGIYVAIPTNGSRANENPSPAPYASTSLLQPYFQEREKNAFFAKSKFEQIFQNFPGLQHSITLSLNLYC